MGIHTAWTDDGQWSVILDIRVSGPYAYGLEELIEDLTPNEKRALAAQLKQDIDTALDRT